MDLIKRKYTMSTDKYGDWIAYVTKFKRCYDNNIIIYQRTGGVYQGPGEGYFTDGGHTMSDLCYFVPNWQEYDIIDKICKHYDCEMIGDNKELQSVHGSQLIQAIIAIYTFIDLKECTYEKQNH